MRDGIAHDGPEPPARARLRAALVLGLLLAGIAGCSGDEPADSRLARLERLAFVPPGETELPVVSPPRAERALLVGIHEVTRGEWREWALFHLPATEPARAHFAAWEPDTERWPASFMTLGEARAFAAAQGMRLPTFSEWFYVAMGRRAQVWPWDQYAAQSVSNTLEMGLGTPCPVGVFEQGKSSLGIYDLIGNVWEWVESDLPPGDEGRVLAAGGSYTWHRRELYIAPRSYFTQELQRGHRSNGVGLRLVADAEEYLRALLAEPFAGPADARRWTEHGRRFGPASVALLEDLRERLPDAREVGWLLEGARP